MVDSNDVINYTKSEISHEHTNIDGVGIVPENRTTAVTAVTVIAAARNERVPARAVSDAPNHRPTNSNNRDDHADGDNKNGVGKNENENGNDGKSKSKSNKKPNGDEDNNNDDAKQNKMTNNSNKNNSNDGQQKINDGDGVGSSGSDGTFMQKSATLAPRDKKAKVRLDDDLSPASHTSIGLPAQELPVKLNVLNDTRVVMLVGDSIRISITRNEREAKASIDEAVRESNRTQPPVPIGLSFGTSKSGKPREFEIASASARQAHESRGTLELFFESVAIVNARYDLEFPAHKARSKDRKRRQPADRSWLEEGAPESIQIGVGSLAWVISLRDARSTRIVGDFIGSSSVLKACSDIQSFVKSARLAGFRTPATVLDVQTLALAQGIPPPLKGIAHIVKSIHRDSGIRDTIDDASAYYDGNYRRSIGGGNRGDSNDILQDDRTGGGRSDGSSDNKKRVKSSARSCASAPERRKDKENVCVDESGRDDRTESCCGNEFIRDKWMEWRCERRRCQIETGVVTKVAFMALDAHYTSLACASLLGHDTKPSISSVALSPASSLCEHHGPVFDFSSLASMPSTWSQSSPSPSLSSSPLPPLSQSSLSSSRSSRSRSPSSSPFPLSPATSPLLSSSSSSSSSTLPLSQLQAQLQSPSTTAASPAAAVSASLMLSAPSSVAEPLSLTPPAPSASVVDGRLISASSPSSPIPLLHSTLSDDNLVELCDEWVTRSDVDQRLFCARPPAEMQIFVDRQGCADRIFDGVLDEDSSTTFRTVDSEFFFKEYYWTAKRVSMLLLDDNDDGVNGAHDTATNERVCFPCSKTDARDIAGITGVADARIDAIDSNVVGDARKSMSHHESPFIRIIRVLMSEWNGHRNLSDSYGRRIFSHVLSHMMRACTQFGVPHELSVPQKQAVCTHLLEHLCLSGHLVIEELAESAGAYYLSLSSKALESQRRTAVKITEDRTRNRFC